MLLTINILDGFFLFVGFTIGLVLLLYVLYLTYSGAAKYANSNLHEEDMELLLKAFIEYREEALDEELYEQMYLLNGIIFCLERGEIPEQAYNFKWVKGGNSKLLMSSNEDKITSLEVDRKIYYKITGTIDNYE